MPGPGVQMTIEIDEHLLRSAMRCTGLQTKKETVEIALRLLTQVHGQAAIRRLRGKVKWKGNLAESRLGRVHP
jgi:Arc/MetJ family transcription regulator